MVGVIYRMNIGPYFYYGSTKNFKRRFLDHKKKLKSKTHENPKCQEQFDHYLDVEFSIIEKIFKGDMESIEQEYLDLYFEDAHCLNMVSHSESARIKKRPSIIYFKDGSSKTFESISALSRYFGISLTTLTNWASGLKRQPRDSNSKRWVGTPLEDAIVEYL